MCIRDRTAGSNDTMFATTADKLWSVTSGTSSPLLPLQSGYVSSATQTNAGGATLLFVNGRDGLFGYRGATWSMMPVTGCDATKWRDICIHQKRVFAHDGKRVWYLDQLAIAGPAYPVTMELHLRNGGEIVGIASISPSGGKGRADILAVATSGGELVTFQGDNPKLAETWSVGDVFDIPPPVARNCFVQHGSDQHLITRDGVLPVPEILTLEPSKKPKGASTDDIKNLWDLAYSLNGNSLSDYNGISSGAARLDLIRVPGAGTFVKPPETDGWSLLSDLDATCWLDDGQHLHFGKSDGTICRYGGQDDNGVAINALMVGAFQDLGETHRFNRARISFDRHIGYTPLFRVLTNYMGIPSGVVGSQTNQSYYSWPPVDWPMMPAPQVTGRTQAEDLWRGLSGRGHAFAPILAVKALAPLIYSGAQTKQV